LHDALSFFADADATVVFVGSHERDLTQHRPALREALLGGVSHELLQHLTVPVLMSH
jgi:nucleotide-binding universal stress UspA family protein